MEVEVGRVGEGLGFDNWPFGGDVCCCPCGCGWF